MTKSESMIAQAKPDEPFFADGGIAYQLAAANIACQESAKLRREYRDKMRCRGGWTAFDSEAMHSMKRKLSDVLGSIYSAHLEVA